MPVARPVSHQPDMQQMALGMLAARYAELEKICARQMSMGFAKLEKKRNRARPQTFADAGLLHLGTRSLVPDPESQLEPKREPE